MKLRTQSISRIEGAYLDIDLAISKDELPITFEGYNFGDCLILRGKLIHEGNKVFQLSADLHADLEGNCARCLTTVRTCMDLKINERFVPAGHESLIHVNEQEDEKPESSPYVYQPHMIDLEQALRDNIVLSLPQKLICGEQCRGLCPTCGQDLNQKQCDCPVDESDREIQSPFDRLKELL